MNLYADLRKNKRIDQNVTVLIEDENSGLLAYGQVVNQSNGGIGVRSDTPFSPGAEISIKMEKTTFKAAPKNFHVSIKWCKQLNGNGSGYLYGLGATYV